MSDDLAPLVQTAVAAAAGCPINGVAIVDPADPSTWRIDFDSSCTSDQMAAGKAAALAFNIAAAEQAGQLDTILAAGLTITSTGTPSLNGTYGVGATEQANITAIASGLNAGKVPDGGSTFEYLDATGTPHSFTSADFINFASAVMNYVYETDLIAAELAAGESESWPAATATIP
jgi:hypothetical protein